MCCVVASFESDCFEELVSSGAKEVPCEGLPMSFDAERLRSSGEGDFASVNASRKAVGIAENVALPVVRGKATRRGSALTGTSRKAVRCEVSSSKR